MMWVSLVFAAAMAAQGAPAAAPATGAAAEAAKPEKPKKVCVEEKMLGSHFAKKICATPEEWEARRRRDEATMRDVGERRAPCNSGGSC